MKNNKKIYQTYNLAHFEDNIISRYNQDLVREEPLTIRLDDKPYSVIMRTPGDEIAHTAGFCLSEGLISSRNDIASITFCDEDDENSITIQLTEKRKNLVSEKIERGGFVSQTSCGICGREMIDDLIEDLGIINSKAEITYLQVIECIEKFYQFQEFYERTRGTHAVMMFDSNFDIIAKAEDVGRHNAMDKSLGTLLLNNKLSDIYLAVLSSRMSFEMIQKAARASIPIIISLSNPTSMAVELGSKLNMTLISLDKEKSGFIVSTGENRIINSENSKAPVK